MKAQDPTVYDDIAQFTNSGFGVHPVNMATGDCRFYAPQRLMYVRTGITGARFRVALNYGLVAVFDLGRECGGNHEEDPEVDRGVAVRLLPLDQLAFYLLAHQGGVTAVAVSLNVLPHVVHTRLSTLTEVECETLDRQLQCMRRPDVVPGCKVVPSQRTAARRRGVSASRARLDALVEASRARTDAEN